LTQPLYPGTLQHQAILHAIVACYQRDPRIRAVAVFGSLGRGNWDQYSDIDLDIVLADGVQLDLEVELQQFQRLLANVGEAVAWVEPDGPAAADVVLQSLMELSVCYHPLHATKPEVVDSLMVLAGDLSVDTIRMAGRANQFMGVPSLSGGIDQYLRLAIGADVALQRRNFWRAVQCLQLMRGLLLSAFAVTHGGARPFYVFQAQADPMLQARVGATLPHYSLLSAQRALHILLDLLENDLAVLTNGQASLSDVHRTIIVQIRERQATLILEDDI
jgi:predicted nucleotidyltransferase